MQLAGMLVLGSLVGLPSCASDDSSDGVGDSATEQTDTATQEIREERAKVRREREKLRRERVRARREAARRKREREHRRQLRAQRERERREQERREQEQAQQAQDCHASYQGACLDPNASDYDCAGGSGDGPEYTGPVQVVGSDDFDLDRDGDGVACEP
jgi:hypothetical protein